MRQALSILRDLTTLCHQAFKVECILFTLKTAFIENLKQRTSAAKFGSIVVSFCAAEMSRKKKNPKTLPLAIT